MVLGFCQAFDDYIKMYCPVFPLPFVPVFPLSSLVSQVFDGPEAVKEKAERLAQLIKESQYFVVHSGAGISTAAGIPDFR